ncbi:GntR family transcriptional regulator [Rhodococcus sp. LB1]|uniref:GntR family transcriptional regulator n=1 Tax=Rhodococcus sp. LB1 TaxID=1807499 RepID=UPI001E37A1C4|nr:GntR family transcriptional regulator [Rhodococcus sp. LB1]
MTTLTRSAIVGGDFAPNQRLIEADLCTQFDASRGTIRAALLDLAAEGLVERFQNRGARIRSVSSAEAAELIELRMVIEGLCASRAAQNVTDAEIEQLTTLRTDLTDAVASRHIFEFARLNQVLHRLIREISGHRSADEILDRLHALLARHQSDIFTHLSKMADSLFDHLDIIDKVCAHNPEG